MTTGHREFIFASYGARETDEGTLMMNRTLTLCILVVAGATAGAGTAATHRPAMSPASSFSARVDNQWFPLLPGTRSRDVMTVTHRTKTIAGVPCVVVDDRLYLLGRLAERTTDWYSQDSRGNVWYFGENTAELDARGQVTSTEGTWTTGVDGAKP